MCLFSTEHGVNNLHPAHNMKVGIPYSDLSPYSDWSV